MLEVQVFGLPRSGTNFLEWTLVNNFEDLYYEDTLLEILDRTKISKEELDFAKTINSNTRNLLQKASLLKHLPPNLVFSHNAITIYKEPDEWKESMKRANKSPDGWTDYDYYMEQAWGLPSENSIVVEHNWACDNYHELLETMVKKFGLKLVECPRQPMQRLDKGGAHCNETGRRFDRNP